VVKAIANGLYAIDGHQMPDHLEERVALVAGKRAARAASRTSPGSESRL
jgi:hypothetical protein